MRNNKGKRWEKHFDDYTVIDLETCGINMEDRNSIIELSAIKVRDGLVIDEFSSLVNPKRPIPSAVIAITGIDNTMVAGAPKAEDVLNDFLDFLGGDIIVGYNINTFDYNIIYDLSDLLCNRVFSNDFVDIYYAARRSMCDVDDHKLTSICEKFNVDFTGAHRALKDCYLTKAAYDKIYEIYGDKAFDGLAHSIDGQDGGSTREPRYTEETQQLRELQKVLFQIIEDGVVSEDEVTMLVEWMDFNSHLRGNYPFDRVYDVIERVLEDGIVDEEELRMLLDKFTEFTSPVKTTCNEVNNIKDNHFVLTGEFRYGTRTAVSEYIISKGGIVDDQVKKCTQFVVIGSLGSQAWKNGVYGSKIKKAMELKDKGQTIELVTEDDFFSKER